MSSWLGPLLLCLCHVAGGRPLSDTRSVVDHASARPRRRGNSSLGNLLCGNRLSMDVCGGSPPNLLLDDLLITTAHVHAGSLQLGLCSELGGSSPTLRASTRKSPHIKLGPLITVYSFLNGFWKLLDVLLIYGLSLFLSASGGLRRRLQIGARKTT